MRKKNYKKILSTVLAMMLIAAMVMPIAGCKEKKQIGSAETVHVDGTVLGEGSKEFSITVVLDSGEETSLTIHTDKDTVGEALMDLGVLAGEDGEYGLYVKTVNGTTVDYEKDGKYWAFYIDGEYSMTGVDTTKITEGESYAFKVEK